MFLRLSVSVLEQRQMNQISLDTFTHGKENILDYPVDKLIEDLKSQVKKAYAEHDEWIELEQNNPEKFNELEEQANRDLARKIVDELERFRLADAVERAVGNLNRRGNDVLDVLAGESGLAQRPQAVVARRIGRSEGRAGATRKLVDHISLRGRERFPVARCLHDVVVAGEDPELAALAPVTGILLAQDFVVRKGIGIDGRRVEIECVHRAARKSRLF